MHTPGPWEIVPYGPNGVYELQGTRDTGGAFKLAVVFPYTRGADALEDARLIASAPALLVENAALRAALADLVPCLEAWQAQYDPDKTDTEAERRLIAARAALAAPQEEGSRT